ncbi:hypothetical protein ASF13_01525 [Erwinia sp. Leaf53]|nr:hypothetical protein ASF13_01525 [Erwinia sp. Leaf53]
MLPGNWVIRITRFACQHSQHALILIGLSAFSVQMRSSVTKKLRYTEEQMVFALNQTENGMWVEGVCR